MPTILIPNTFRAVDINGFAVPGALATFYDAGTTRLRTVYADPDAQIPHPSPLAADGAGVFPPIYDSGEGDAKVEVTTPEGVMLPGYPLDPAPLVSTDMTGAASVSFQPTPEIPETNVRDALLRIQQNIVEPLADYGLGVTGNAGLLANINATNTASGIYRFDGTTAGTFPSEVSRANGGIVRIWRQTANSALMILTEAGTRRQYTRILAGGSWDVWSHVMQDTDTAGDDVWRAGSSNVPRVVSPAAVMAAIRAKALGEAQTWQNMLPNRSTGTIYTNGTGRPIQVAISQDATGGVLKQIQVRNGPNAGWITVAQSNDYAAHACFVVPPGGQYRSMGNPGLLYAWSELR